MIEVQIFTEQRRNGRGRVFNQWLRTYKIANKRWNVEVWRGGRGEGNFLKKSEKNDWSVWLKKRMENKTVKFTGKGPLVHLQLNYCIMAGIDKLISNSNLCSLLLSPVLWILFTCSFQPSGCQLMLLHYCTRRYAHTQIHTHTHRHIHTHFLISTHNKLY